MALHQILSGRPRGGSFDVLADLSLPGDRLQVGGNSALAVGTLSPNDGGWRLNHAPRPLPYRAGATIVWTDEYLAIWGVNRLGSAPSGWAETPRIPQARGFWRGWD
jgi:hypothetical protein